MTENTELLQSKSLLSKEKITYLENYILKGSKLIIDKQYKKAIDYFDNKEVAEKMGFLYSDRNMTTCGFLSKTPSPEDISSIADGVASFSSSRTVYDRQIRIVLSTVVAVPQGKNNPAVFIPESLLHEISLIHLEEWLHGLQHLKLQPIAGHYKPEIDIAVYMLNHKIPMTKAFLQRYDRDRQINELKKDSFISHVKNFTNIIHLVKDAFNRKGK